MRHYRTPPLLAATLVTLVYATANVAAPLALSTRTPRAGWNRTPSLRNLVGFPILAAGVGTILWSAASHATKWRERDWRVLKFDPEHLLTPEYLVIDGPYRYSRNPLYVGDCLMWTGWAVLLGSPAVARGLAVLCVGLQVGVRLEERGLARQFGSQWKAYASTVPRFIGRRACITLDGHPTNTAGTMSAQAGEDDTQRGAQAMRTGFSSTVRIRVPPEQVFWFLADPSTASVIDPAVVSYEPDGGTMGLGVQNRLRLRILGVPVKLTSLTTVWEPGERMEFRSIRPSRPAVGLASHRFEPCAEGTDYTWSMEFTPTGFGGRLAAAVGAVMFERNAKAQQERVRVVLEAVALR